MAPAVVKEEIGNSEPDNDTLGPSTDDGDLDLPPVIDTQFVEDPHPSDRSTIVDNIATATYWTDSSPLPSGPPPLYSTPPAPVPPELVAALEGVVEEGGAAPGHRAVPQAIEGLVDRIEGMESELRALREELRIVYLVLLEVRKKVV